MNRYKKHQRARHSDLAVTEQDLTRQEMQKMQGGASNLNSSKSNSPTTEKSVIICQRCGKVGVDKNPCCPPPSLPNL